jgi:acid phosphatase type 7
MPNRTPPARRARVAAVVAATIAAVALPGTAHAATATFAATADARVHESAPTTSYGTSSTLRIDGSTDPDVETYVRFAPTGLSGTVTRAVLRLWATSPSARGPLAYGTTATWSETAITWANRPARGPSAGPRAARIDAGAWLEVDVTSLVTGNGAVGIVLATDTVDGADFTSRQGTAANRPQLVVTTSTPTSAVRVVAAGDIACAPGAACLSGARATANVIGGLAPSLVLALGDTQYQNGTAAEFAAYDSTWGRFKAITRPAIGNHEYGTPNASGYFGYFGSAAGNPSQGYYSFDVGAWHVVALNSNCTIVSCSATSAQATWLRSDLRAHPTQCTLAMLHHPLFSSAGSASTLVRPLWQILYDENADLVLDGHQHNYERFAPQTPAGARDDARGLRQFTVGTGGVSLGGFSTTAANSQRRFNGSHGVLLLTLRPSSYDWSFRATTAGSITETGTTACH